MWHKEPKTVSIWPFAEPPDPWPVADTVAGECSVSLGKPEMQA